MKYGGHKRSRKHRQKKNIQHKKKRKAIHKKKKLNKKKKTVIKQEDPLKKDTQDLEDKLKESDKHLKEEKKQIMELMRQTNELESAEVALPKLEDQKPKMELQTQSNKTIQTSLSQNNHNLNIINNNSIAKSSFLGESKNSSHSQSETVSSDAATTIKPKMVVDNNSIDNKDKDSNPNVFQTMFNKYFG